MNLKKLLMIVITIMMLLMVVLQSKVYATVHQEQPPANMGYIRFMEDTNNFREAYAIKDGEQPIWNIVRYDSSTANTYKSGLNLYCLKAGIGMATPNKRQNYDIYFDDMKTDRNLIKTQPNIGDTLQNLVDGKIEENISTYNAILAILDMLYLPNQATELDKKELIYTILKEASMDSYFTQGSKLSLMVKAFEFPEENMNSENFLNDILMNRYPLNELNLTNFALTDNDIKAIQQAALWYFTNYGEKDGLYNQVGKGESWIKYKNQEDSSLADNTYYSLMDYKPNGLNQQDDAGMARALQAKALYEYIIKKAKEYANQDDNQDDNTSSTERGPIDIETTILNKKDSEGNYIIGPIKMSQTNLKKYTIDFVVKNNGQKITNYTLLDKNERPVANGTTVKDLVGENFYISIPKEKVQSLTIDITVNFYNKTMKLWASTVTPKEQPIVEVDEQLGTYKKTLSLEVTPEPEEKPFDLALRKYITKVERDGKEITIANASNGARVPNIKESSLQNEKTATYRHRKDPVVIKTGDIVTYKITIYNEGEKAGRATQVIDQLPTGLKFVEVVSGNFEKKSYDSTTNNQLVLERKSGNTTNLPAYTEGNLVTGSETIEIKCEVTEKPDFENEKILTNIAWISKAFDAEDNKEITTQGDDWDSLPSNQPTVNGNTVNKDNMSNYIGNNNKPDLTDSTFYYKGQEDDDDFEKLKLLPEEFDLKLVKYISAVNGDTSKGKIIEKIDTTKLASGEETTAEYKSDKTAVNVKVGDYVTYTFRIYNEGDIDGYVTKLTDNIPLGLQFVQLAQNEQGQEDGKTITIYSYDEENGLTSENVEVDTDTYGLISDNNSFWGIDKEEDGTNNKIDTYDGDSTPSISLDVEAYLGGTNKLLKAYDASQDVNHDGKGLDYVDATVVFRVSETAIEDKVMRNEAAITGATDEDGNEIKDRDSEPENWPGKDDHDNYQDDEDYDNVIIKSEFFDLALRKFIIGVGDETKINKDAKEIDKKVQLLNANGLYARAPEVDTSKLNTVDEDGKLITTATYNHTKEPIIVRPNDMVVYMLRVYNEGDIDGYAAEIKDHLPPYLEFVKGEYNKQYGWEVSEDGRTVTTKYLAPNESQDNIIAKAKTETSGKIVLSYKEVPIMCKVSANPKTNQNITNIADITKYLDENEEPVTDRDSQEKNVKLPKDEELPTYKDNEKGSYVPGQEDDDDFEKVNVKIFDLALRKWVTQAIVIENGQQTVTQTGHDAWDDPEAVVKVELHRKKINQVTVKFKYSIRVYNQGEIEGYAKEVTDYIPEGLKFVAEDNPGWTDEGNGVISTRLLENTLLQPGEYADVEVLLTWINSEDNMGVMNNIAEISEDYNKYDVPDIDSTPDNQKPGEDDIDDAPVMLSISTGQVRIYFTLGLILLITTASGVILIKRYVL